MSRMNQAIDNVKVLKQFISPSQLHVLGAGTRGEEKGFFFDKIQELAELFTTMPKTYETDGQGDDAIVHLHYFNGSQDWYIIERDMEDEQYQAFGMADIGFGLSSSGGYISLIELMECNIELDLHWTPKTKREVKASHA